MIPNEQSGFSSSGLFSAAATRGPYGSFFAEAYRPSALDARARQAGVTLLELETHRLQQLLRIQAAEARLAHVVWDRRRRGGRRAVRQIERERQRLGRELHTGVGQLLAAIRMQTELIDRHLATPPPAVAQALRNLGTLASEGLEQVRSLSRRFLAPEWQRLSLDAALRRLCEISGVAQQYTGEIHIAPLGRDPDPDIKTLFYRAAQEALSNIVRHSRATRIDISFEQRDNQLVLTIRDNGVGFDPATVFGGPADVASGIGLRAIREQAADLGGKLLVQSGANGTTLEVSMRLLSSNR